MPPAVEKDCNKICIGITIAISLKTGKKFVSETASAYQTHLKQWTVFWTIPA
jgi:hypothetical protein